jgi:hypothetical protein
LTRLQDSEDREKKFLAYSIPEFNGICSAIGFERGEQGIEGPERQSVLWGDIEWICLTIFELQGLHRS